MTHANQEQCDAAHRFDDEQETPMVICECCKDEVREYDFLVCETCESRICEDCEVECNFCGRSGCTNCMEKHLDDYYCDNGECLEKELEKGAE